MDIQFESKLLIIISYFDEVYGPQVLEVYPKGQSEKFQDIRSIMTVLLDVASVSEGDNWRFLYADENFASQNIRITVINEEARGGLSDLMISLLIEPPHPQHIAAMGQDWSNIFYLQEQVSETISFKGNMPDFEIDELQKLLSSVHTEVIEQFQFFLDLLSPGMHSIS